MKKRNAKSNILFLIIWNTILLLIIVLIQGSAFGQNHKRDIPLTGFLKNWSVNVNSDNTSFFYNCSHYKISNSFDIEAEIAARFVDNENPDRNK